MADVSNVRTNWENVSHQDWLENNARAQANNISGSEMNTIGNALKAINSEVGAFDTRVTGVEQGITNVNTRIDNLDLDLSDLPFISQTRDITDTEPRWKTTLTGDILEIEMVDVMQHWVNGNKVAWLNEWGAFRATSAHAWGDAGSRYIREDWDNVVAGRCVELVDRRTGAGTNPMWGRKWRDGMLVRNGIDMSDCWVKNGSTPVPPELPEGTLVVQI